MAHQLAGIRVDHEALGPAQSLHRTQGGMGFDEAFRGTCTPDCH